MRINPNRTEALALRLHVRSGTGNAPRGERMIPTEHYREAPFVERSVGTARDIRADIRNGPEEACTALSTARGILAKWDVDIPRVIDIMSQLDETITEIGVANG